MTEIKWIKITTNMFEDEKIDYIESLPKADTIIIIWIKLLTLAGKCNANGKVFLTENLNYSIEMLSHKFKKSLSVTKKAIETLEKLQMIEFDDGGFLHIVNWSKHQNIEGLDKIREQTRRRVARYREEQKKEECNVTPETVRNVTSNVTVTQSNETELELDIDIDKDISASTKLAAAEADIPYQEIVDLYNQNCPRLIKVERITHSRKKAIKELWTEHKDDLTIFETLFQKAGSSDFLNGSPKGWQADFDWLIRQENMARVLEGKYDKNYQKEGGSYEQMGADGAGSQIPEGYFPEDWD